MMSKKRCGLNATFRVVLVFAMVAASTPTIAVAQDSSNASLVRRIEQLERTNADLERRIRDIESAIRRDSASSRPIAITNKWREQANWRRLRTGLSMDEVRALLGEPERVDGGGITTWRWADGHVLFILNKVDSWSEPKV